MPKFKHLEIVDRVEEPVDQSVFGSSSDTLLRRNRRYKSKTFVSCCENLENNVQPLYTLLGSFGKIIPERNREGLLQDAASIMLGRQDGWIEVSLVCFHTLHNVATVKIEWVDCLSLHLEFDSRARTLKLFRYPSVCFLLRRNETNGETSIMSRYSWSA